LLIGAFANFSSANAAGDWPCLAPRALRQRLFYLILESHDGRAVVPIPKRSTSP
jgi:hypothetical protein